MWLFSVNSFQEMSPSTSGDELVAASISRSSVPAPERVTTVLPPIARASNPGAADGIHNPPRAWTALPRSVSFSTYPGKVDGLTDDQ